MTRLAQDFFSAGSFEVQTSGGRLNPSVPNQVSVQSLSELTALLVPADKSSVYVEDQLAKYFYDAESMASVDGLHVLKPDSITALQPGRWNLQRANSTGFLQLQGTWDANTNTPDLTSLTPPAGHYWYVSAAGTTALGDIADWTVGDLAVSLGGGNWMKIDGTPIVLSVNGEVGVIVLDTNKVPEGSSNLYFTDSRARSAAVSDSIVDGVIDKAPSQNAVFDALAANSSADRSRGNHTGTQLSSTISDFSTAAAAAAPVQSVAGKVGNVTLNQSDVTYTEIVTSGSVSANYGQSITVTASSTITLPASPGLGDRQKSIRVKRRYAGGGVTTVSGNGNNIDGTSTITLANNESIVFVWNNTSGEWERH